MNLSQKQNEQHVLLDAKASASAEGGGDVEREFSLCAYEMCRHYLFVLEERTTIGNAECASRTARSCKMQKAYACRCAARRRRQRKIRTGPDVCTDCDAITTILYRSKPIIFIITNDDALCLLYNPRRRL